MNREEFIKKWEADYGKGIERTRAEMRRDLDSLLAGAKAEGMRLGGEIASCFFAATNDYDDYQHAGQVIAHEINKKAEEIEKKAGAGGGE